MMTHVAGRNNRGSVVLYALSTCPWCKKTKRLLQEHDVPYDYVDVDLVAEEDEDAVVGELERWNPMRSFPTLVINGKAIIGFQEFRIREALEL